jgi:hypothetical protein
MKRISCAFDYSDIKSVEAKVLARLAKDKVRSECALLGVRKPVVKIERAITQPEDGRRRRLFRGEAYALIPE